MKIPLSVKTDAKRIVSDFNAKAFPNPEDDSYVIRCKGCHLYLDRFGNEYKVPCKVCRLSYTGDLSQWKFSIYKYSRKEYDSEECMFPGAECVDGTIEGALQAGLEAYP